MSREVRRVPKDWEHPEKMFEDGKGFVHLSPHDHWEGYLEDYNEHPDSEDWESGPPTLDQFMPDWPEEEKTHYQMYETVSAGTPISPVMETQEDLARWLTDNSGDASAGMTATYEQWLAMIKTGSCPTMFTFIDSGEVRIISGVAAVSEKFEEKK